MVFLKERIFYYLDVELPELILSFSCLCSMIFHLFFLTVLLLDKIFNNAIDFLHILAQNFYIFLKGLCTLSYNRILVHWVQFCLFHSVDFRVLGVLFSCLLPAAFCFSKSLHFGCLFFMLLYFIWFYDTGFLQCLLIFVHI